MDGECRLLVGFLVMLMISYMHLRGLRSLGMGRDFGIWHTLMLSPSATQQGLFGGLQ